MPAPNIDFATKTSVPAAATAKWRSRIAFVGEFSQGPTDPLVVDPQSFETIYSNDTTTGSANVQQAVNVGATDIVISRAVPADSAATTTLTIESGNPLNVDPVVGYEVDSGEYNPTVNTNAYTTGVSLDLGYISDAIVERTIYEEVTVKDKILKHPSFEKTNERGFARFFVADFKAGRDASTREIKFGNVAHVLSVTTVAASTGDYQVVSIDTNLNDYEAVKDNILPGYVLAVPSDTSVPIASISKQFLILSKPFTIGTNKVGVLVQNIDNSVAETIATYAVVDPAEDYYVLGYRVRLDSTESTLATVQPGSNYFQIPNETYNNGYTSNAVDAYLALPASQLEGAELNFKYLTTTASSITSATLLGQEGFVTDVVGYRFTVLPAEVGNSLTVGATTLTTNSVVKTTDTITLTRTVSEAYTPTYVLVYSDGTESDVQTETEIPAGTTDPTLTLTPDLTALEAIQATEGIRIQFDGGAAKYIALVKGGQFLVQLGSGYVTAGSTSYSSASAYTVGTLARQIALDLQQAIYSDITVNSLIESVAVDVSIFPYVLTLKTAILGKNASRVKYRIERHVKGGVLASAADIYLAVNTEAATLTPSANYTSFSGSFKGPVSPEKLFYAIDGTPLTLVKAYSPGNKVIKVTITPASSTDPTYSKFNVATEYKVGNTIKNELISVSTRLLNPATGLYTDSLKSSVIRLYFVPYLDNPADTVFPANLYTKLPVRTVPLLGSYSTNYSTNYGIALSGTNYTSNVLLAKGSDFSYTGTPSLSVSQIRKEAYLAAVKRLASINVAAIGIVGIAYGDPTYAEVFEEAIRQANNVTPEEGKRQLFFETIPRLPSKQASTLSAQINDPNVCLVAGRITQQLNSGSLVDNVGAVGKVLGLFSVRPPYISQHAYNGLVINDVVQSDSYNLANRAYKDDLTDGRVELFFYDDQLKTHKFLNGRTTSYTDTDSYVSVVRLRYQVMSDIHYLIKSQSLSQPGSAAQRRQLETSIDAYLSTKLSLDWFAEVRPTICDDSNNSDADLSKGIVNIQVSYKPTIPQDYFRVTQTEYYDTFTVPVNVG